MKSWKKQILIGFVFLVLLGVSWFGYAVYSYFTVTLPNAYALWVVGDMVIDYLDNNNRAWPKSWDDLEDSFQVCASRGGPHFSFAQLQDLIVIDFSAKPAELAKAIDDKKRPPFQVIFRKDGRTSHWSGREPNAMVLSYLKNPYGEMQPPPRAKHLAVEERGPRRILIEMRVSFRLENDGYISSVNMGSPVNRSMHTDQDLVHLQPLSHVRELMLAYSHITDEGLDYLNGMKELSRLDIYNTKISDEGLKKLIGFSKLDTLVMASNQFTDKGMEHVGKMEQLTFLNINGSQVTDNGLQSLHGLKKLRELMLYSTKTTKTGIEQLQKALPNCNVQCEAERR